MEQPLVSIIIPVYNCEKYVAEAIYSALNQTYPRIEILVVDDGSTDASLKVVSEIPGVKVLSQINAGAPKARNFGLNKSSGEYIKFLDADDLLHLDAISNQVKISLTKLTDFEIIYGDFDILSDSSATRRIRNRDLSIEGEHKIVLSDLMTSTPLHRREHLKAVGGFDERLRRGQEWNLHVRLSVAGYKFVYNPGSIYSYREHNSDVRISRRPSSSIVALSKEWTRYELTYLEIKNTTNSNYISAFSYLFWNLGRRALREKHYKFARKCFSKARCLSDDYKRYWPKYYHLLHSFLGAYLSEKLLVPIFAVRRVLRGVK